jgi:hypothetical protein
VVRKTQTKTQMSRPRLAKQARPTRECSVLNEFQENLKKSIDTLSGVQLKDALSPASPGSQAGELTTGKNKKIGKIEKSVDALLALR